MIEQLQSTLAEIAQPFGDRRIHHCQVTLNQAADGSILLTGSVLDDETLTAVAGGLSNSFPSIKFDASGLEVLRQSTPTILTVTTNIAGLHAKSSFGSEQLSQLLAGRSVEQLVVEDSWVYIRQRDGYLGWTYRQYLDASPAPEPAYIVCEPVSLLRREPLAQSAITSRLLAGTTVATGATQAGYGQLLLAAGMSGWAPLSDLRSLGQLPAPESEQRQQMTQDSSRFIGVPYLWGGISALGIDCSGFVRLLHSLVGIAVPRDADMQFNAGRPVEPPFRPGDLLFFGSKKGHRSISHVGMSLGEWQMIHASRSRNGVYVDDVQEVTFLRDSFVGARSLLGF